MSRIAKTYVLLPALLMACVILDGVLTVYFKSSFHTTTYHLVIQLTYVACIHMAIMMPSRRLVLWAIVLGIMYDVYYGGVISLYAVPIVITIYVLSQFVPHLKQNFINSMIIMFIGLMAINMLQFPMAQILKLDTPLFVNYFVIKVLPTVLLNISFYGLLYPIWRKVFLLLKTN